MVTMKLLAVPVLFSITALIAPSLVSADSEGTLLYKRSADNEANGYPRVIQLQHAGDMSGNFLATWEHWYTKGPKNGEPKGTPGNFIIRESDNGNDWTTLATIHDPQKDNPRPFFYQPFLFEFPQKLGKYPAGTILLVGNLVNSTSTEFVAWRSQDHGKTWDVVGPWQHGGIRDKTGGGIWEPFIFLDNKGRLLAYFSDERHPKEHSQMLVHVVSEDGGDTWGKKVVRDVASKKQSDRPGMASVAKMDNGEYFMSYEFCRQVNANCPVHGKMSPDGYSWTPSDVGSAIGTADDISLWASPNTVWDPSTKQLLVAAQNQYLDNTNGKVSPEQHRAILINTQHGKGEWVWAPSPWTASTEGTCSSNRSPNLLPLPDGTIRYSAAAGQGQSGRCSEWTGKAPIGALPYRANFSANGQAGWINFGGKWSTSDDKYGFEPAKNASAVAVTGSSGWTDYEVSADVMISGGSGEVGLVSRVSASKTGFNSLKKYAATISSTSGNLTISKEGDASTVLHSEKHPGGIKGNKWYHLLFSVQAKKLTITLSEDESVSKTSFTSNDDTFPQGMAGLVGDNGSGSFKNVQIKELT